MKRLALFLLFTIPQLVLRAQNWLPLDKGIECFYVGDVRYTFVDSTGDMLYVSGGFNQDGNCIPMMGIAQWNGVKWDSIGNANAGSAGKHGVYKYRDTLFSFGNFYPANIFKLAKWNGNSWDTLHNGPNDIVTCYAEKSGELYMGGYFDQCGDDSTLMICKYDGHTFTGLTPYYGPNWQLGFLLSTIAFYHDTLYMGGQFCPTGQVANFAKYYNGDYQIVDPQFSGLGSPSYIETMAVYKDELYIGGYFRKQDGFTGDYIMKWNGTSFSEVGGGVDARVTTMNVFGDRLYVGGLFSHAGDSTSLNLAAWDGTQWHTFNDTFGPNPYIRNINFYRDTLIVSGHFKTINGDTVNHIAKYNHALPKPQAVLPDQNTISLYPNPASDGLSIGLSIAEEQNIKIEVYDIRGRLVDVLLDEKRSAGVYSVSYNLANLRKGMYFVSFHSDKSGQTKKFVKY